MKISYLISILFIVLASSCTTSSKLENQILVKKSEAEYGDDSEFIQQAIDSKISTITLENNKIYYVSKTLYLNDNQHFDGNGSTIKMQQNIPFHLFEMKNKNNIEIKNLKIVGLLPQVSDYMLFREKNIIKLDDSRNIFLENISVTHHGFTCFSLHDCNVVKINKCVFEKIGLPVSSNTLYYYSYDCIFLGAEKESNTIDITNCEFRNIGTEGNIKISDNDADGIHLQSLKVDQIKNIKILNNTFDSCSARGIKVQSGKWLEIQNNHFNQCSMGVGISMANAVSNVDVNNNILTNCNIVFGTNSMDTMVASNIVYGKNIVRSCGFFFRVNGLSFLENSKIIHNDIDTIQYCFTDAIFRNCQIENNKIQHFGLKNDASYYMCMLIGPPSKNVLIRNNEISTTSKSICAIYIIKGAKEIQIEDNNITMLENVHQQQYIVHFSDENYKSNSVNKIKLIKQ